MAVVEVTGFRDAFLRAMARVIDVTVPIMAIAPKITVSQLTSSVRCPMVSPPFLESVIVCLKYEMEFTFHFTL